MCANPDSHSIQTALTINDNMEAKDDKKYVEFKELAIRYAIDKKLYSGQEHDYLPIKAMLADETLKDCGHVRELYRHCADNYGYDKATSCPRFRIRKLTPRECFRLMDVNDTDIDKIQAFRWSDNDYETDCDGKEVINVETGKRQRHRMWQPISASKQYQLAGNSIVISCLYHIFKNLFVKPTFSQPVPNGYKMGEGGQPCLF